MYFRPDKKCLLQANGSINLFYSRYLHVQLFYKRARFDRRNLLALLLSLRNFFFSTILPSKAKFIKLPLNHLTEFPKFEFYFIFSRYFRRGTNFQYGFYRHFGLLLS